MRSKYPGMAADWGRKGGRPRKPDLAEVMGEAKMSRRRKADPP